MIRRLDGIIKSEEQLIRIDFDNILIRLALDSTD
jgi:hypothetical protein